MATDYGYLQHGAGTIGSFHTERIRVKCEHSDHWLAWYEGRWRRVHIQMRRMLIVYQGERITLLIEGV